VIPNLRECARHPGLQAFCLARAKFSRRALQIMGQLPVVILLDLFRGPGGENGDSENLVL
jgi:hypothetical protein